MKNQNEKQACARKTSIGGQALMEGIMMRGPKKTALAVRNPRGEIVVEEFETKGVKRPAICRLPIIRGIFGYIDSMTVGYKCLMRSAEISALDELVEKKPEKKEWEQEAPAEAETQTDTQVEAEKKSEDKIPAWMMTLVSVISVILAVVIAVGLFVMLPTFLYETVRPYVPLFNSASMPLNSLWKSIFEGILKIMLMVGYMAAVSLMKDIRRTFMYHGAEHKTIFCYEAGLELTVENVKRQKRFHPRCGTSFLILMLLVSIFISFFIDPITVLIRGSVLPPLLRSGLKLLLIPIIVGLGYELIKFAGRHDNIVTRIISLPGVWLQHITVFEPTDDMIECAIRAVREVIPEDQSDNW